ncbi:hypothetical protein ACIQVT_34525 [Streptomyces sp. NPDC100445]|uniref:hypothetical protein n=1 Tax=Streptomyces sp. NPDC100445 TaxID=3366102 RepID=UPI00381D87E3
MTNKLTQLGVLLACVAGFVFLSATGKDTGAFVAFVGPVLAGVFVTAHVNSRSDAQDSVLAKISEQTNGVLTKRIETAVTAALDKRSANAATGDSPTIVRGAD